VGQLWNYDVVGGRIFSIRCIRDVIQHPLARSCAPVEEPNSYLTGGLCSLECVVAVFDHEAVTNRWPHEVVICSSSGLCSTHQINDLTSGVHTVYSRDIHRPGADQDKLDIARRIGGGGAAGLVCLSDRGEVGPVVDGIRARTGRWCVVEAIQTLLVAIAVTGGRASYAVAGSNSTGDPKERTQVAR